MKRLLILMMSVLVLSACGSETSGDPEVEDALESNKVIEVNQELAFMDFRATIEKVEVYQEDGAHLMDIPVKWLNLTEDRKMLMQVTGMDVKQGEELLSEVNNAWLDNKGEVRKENASRGEWTANLTYELINDSDPVTIAFVPWSGGGSQEITIEIQ